MEPPRQILGSDIYVHQFKINAKAASAEISGNGIRIISTGSKKTACPRRWVAILVVFLEDVNEFNGPLLLVPGSHKLGVIELQAEKRRNGGATAAQSAYGNSPA